MSKHNAETAEQYEWGVSHSQGIRKCRTENVALHDLAWLSSQYERNHRNKVRPALMRRKVGPWEPVHHTSGGVMEPTTHNADKVQRVADLLDTHHPGDYTHLFHDDPGAVTPPVACRCGWRGTGRHAVHVAEAIVDDISSTPEKGT
jgi:hypothetical protein